jgi:hypothetical protein
MIQSAELRQDAAHHFGPRVHGRNPIDNQRGEADRACVRTHGAVGDLLSLIPAPAPGKDKDDPFVTLSCRAAKAWLALFSYATKLASRQILRQQGGK